MRKQTKIVATISDLRCDQEFIQTLYDAGMDVVRLNTAHQTEEDTLRVIDNVRAVSNKIPLLLDTKGPEIRTTKGEETIILKKGQNIQVRGDPTKISTSEKLYVSYDNIVADVPVGTSILIDDGDIELIVKEKEDDKLFCEVQNDGEISGRKSVNIPGIHINLPSLTEKDKNYIRFAAQNNIEFIAHSFVRNKEDVIEIKNILKECNANIKIIAKIENEEGVRNIEEILDHAYGIMVARGDLGIEIPAEKIPGIQKKLIETCIRRKKPVITATQMLHTMIKNPRATRAEISDIANAIFDGTDAIMLSGETAYGKHPLAAVQTMTKVALEVESQKELFNETAINKINTHPDRFLAKSAVRASLYMDAKAIVIDTAKGRTARTLASYRGKNPIYAMCYDDVIMRELALSYGVYAFKIEQQETSDAFIKLALEKLIASQKLEEEDLTIILAGNFGATHRASFLEITTPKNRLHTRTNDTKDYDY